MIINLVGGEGAGIEISYMKLWGSQQIRASCFFFSFLLFLLQGVGLCIHEEGTVSHSHRLLGALQQGIIFIQLSSAATTTTVVI
jgi:hypothetical protein